MLPLSNGSIYIQIFSYLNNSSKHKELNRNSLHLKGENCASKQPIRILIVDLINILNVQISFFSFVSSYTQYICLIFFRLVSNKTFLMSLVRLLRKDRLTVLFKNLSPNNLRFIKTVLVNI